MGMRMPGWFDITHLGGDDLNRNENVEGVVKSVKHLHSIIDEQIGKGIPNDRIIVGGFSQGGAVSLLVLSFLLSFPSFNSTNITGRNVIS
jgi:predicted esterase